MEYSQLGSGEPISQKVSGNCVETTFERTNGLKSEYEIYVDWMNPNQLAEVSFQLPFHDWQVWQQQKNYKGEKMALEIIKDLKVKNSMLTAINVLLIILLILK